MVKVGIASSMGEMALAESLPIHGDDNLAMAMFFASSMGEMALAEAYQVLKPDHWPPTCQHARGRRTRLLHDWHLVARLTEGSHRRLTMPQNHPHRLAYLIGIAAMFVVMNMVLGKEELTSPP